MSTGKRNICPMGREKATGSKNGLFRNRQQCAGQVAGRIFFLELQGIFCRVCSVGSFSSPKHREPPAVQLLGAVVIQVMYVKKWLLFI